MYLSGSWDCTNCNESNDFEGDIKEINFNNKLSKCSYCGCKVKLSGYVDLYIEAEENNLNKGYYNITTVYYKDNITIYKDHTYKAKEPIKNYHGYEFTEINLGKLPPDYPNKENEYWILIE